LSFSARAIWDDFKDENAANGEHGSDLPLPAQRSPPQANGWNAGFGVNLRGGKLGRWNICIWPSTITRGWPIPKSCRMKHAAPA
jgi:hypothetical protein